MKKFVLTPHREKILRHLARSGGRIADQSGLVNDMLRQVTGHHTSQALAGVLKSLEDADLIRRDMNGRRTYAIELVEKNIRPEDLERWRGEVSRNGSAAAPETVQLPAAEDDLDQLAASLLRQTLLTLRRRDDEDPAMRLKLMRAEEQAEALRKRVAELEGQVREANSALFEANKRAEQAEKVAKGLRVAADRPARGTAKVRELLSDEDRKNLDRLMRKPPARSE